LPLCTASAEHTNRQLNGEALFAIAELGICDADTIKPTAAPDLATSNQNECRPICRTTAAAAAVVVVVAVMRRDASMQSHIVC